MCGIGFCGGGITSSGATLETSEGLVDGRLIKDQKLLGLTMDQIRQYIRVYVDGTEFATAEATSLSANGTIDIGSEVMHGATFFLSKLGNP